MADYALATLDPAHETIFKELEKQGYCTTSIVKVRGQDTFRVLFTVSWNRYTTECAKALHAAKVVQGSMKARAGW